MAYGWPYGKARREAAGIDQWLRLKTEGATRGHIVRYKIRL